MKTLTLTQIRKLAVTKQRLTGKPAAANMNGLKDVLRSIRCLQIDPIRAVERTQHLVLHSRLDPYTPDLLHRAAYQEKFMFEYWAHAASYVLTEDYPIHKLHMANFFSGNNSWLKHAREWMEQNPQFQQYVLDTLGARGALLARELEDKSLTPWKSGGWTSDRNAPMMVDFLWRAGKLMVADRQGLRKYWDLSERCLPDWTPQDALSDEEKTSRAAQLSLKALGVGSKTQISNHFIRKRYPKLTETLAQLEREGLIEQVAITGVAKLQWARQAPWYIHRDDLDLVDQLETDWEPRTVLLSPFDNLICDRERTELLWDFRFRIEIYVPKAKRKFGYYVLPILHGERLIGRIDSKMDRKAGVLHVNNIYAEADAPTTKKTAAAIHKTIKGLAKFLGASKIDIGKVHFQAWRDKF